MLSPFDALSERLLGDGVEPRYVRRYVAELKDHLDDLIAEERRKGSKPMDAEKQAHARLGSTETLAEAMVARREFRTWSAKAPAVTYLIAPSLGLVVCTALAVASLVLTVTWLRRAGGIPSETPLTRDLAAGVVVFSNTVLPVLLGWALGATAIRQRSAPLWPVFGMVVLAVIGAAVQVGVTLPSASAHGEIGLSGSFGPSLADWASFAGRLARNLVLTLAAYAGLRLWFATRAGGGALT